MEVKRFDEWNRGCVPFLDKLWKKIDSGLIDGAYVSDNKILINHIDGVPREIVLNDPTDAIDNDSTLAIYCEEEGYKLGKSYKVNFIKDKEDFSAKFIALKKGNDHVMISRKYVGYASVFEIMDNRYKDNYIRIEFQNNDDTLCNEDMFIMRLLDINMDSKIEDVYQIVCDTVLNYRNYSKIVMEKVYYKNTLSFVKKILGEVILESGELKRLVTDRALGDAIINFAFDVDKGCSFNYKGKSSMKLDDLYKLEGYARKLISK